MYARGDENNRDVHGRIPGFVVAHLDARYRIGRDLELFARVNNVFDRRYSNFGVLGENFFTGPDRTFGPASGAGPAVEQFRAPGTPRGGVGRPALPMDLTRGATGPRCDRRSSTPLCRRFGAETPKQQTPIDRTRADVHASVPGSNHQEYPQ